MNRGGSEAGEGSLRGGRGEGSCYVSHASWIAMYHDAMSD